MACRFLESSQNSYLILWKRKWIWVWGYVVIRRGRAAEVKTIREAEYRGLHVAGFRADDMRGGEEG
jgi:hypothetical protein